jgi:hypothetical protein
MSLPNVASPLSNPIANGQSYQYFVANIGATSITFEDNALFQLSVSGNLLFVRYVGGPGPSATYYVTIHANNADGTVTQQIPFTISGPIDPIGNITSATTTTAAIGAAVQYRITATNPGGTGFDRYSASGLPTGLSVDAFTGQIIGVPPGMDGTYFVTLKFTSFRVFSGGAVLPYTYSRYWMLVVGAGSDPINGGGGSGGIFVSSGTATSFTFSNVFTTASLMAGPVFEVPFRADPRNYLYHVQYKVKLASYQKLALDVSGPYGGIHVGESQFKNERGGILTFWRTFALVPFARDEWESHTYGFQWWHTEGGTGSITEIPKTVNSRVHYDYFNTTSPETTIQLPHAPRVINVFGALYAQNGYGSLIPGQEILAADATYKQWHGNIYERMQRFVREESATQQLLS